jgi:tetratricopeptide (TPR) repeat protein
MRRAVRDQDQARLRFDGAQPRETVQQTIEILVRIEVAAVHERLVGIYLHNGEWTRVENALERAIQIYRQIGEEAHWMNAQIDISWIHLFQGKLPLALSEFEQDLEMAENGNSWSFLARALLGKAAAELACASWSQSSGIA